MEPNKKLTLRNDFHLTSYRVITNIGKTLSEDQVRRAKKALCKDYRCTCSDKTGARGMQEGFEIEKIDNKTFKIIEKASPDQAVNA